MHDIVKSVAVALGLLFAAPAWAGSVVTLSPADDIAAALRKAAPGTVIELEPGDYGALTLGQVAGSVEEPLVLRSKDGAKPARLSRLDLREVSHLVLDGLTFDYDFSPDDPTNFRPFQVFTTRDLTIRHTIFDGGLTEQGNREESGYPTGIGLAVRASAGIVVEDSEFRNFYRGLLFSDTVDVVVRRNDIHTMRMDGLDFAQAERILIEDNLFHDFRRPLSFADHSDMIQFWTNGTERPSRDIMIRRNVLNSGTGWFTQSIFMRNDLVDRGLAGGEMFYRNVTIAENVIINAHLHGITVGETAGLVIRNNTLVHNARSDGNSKPSDAEIWRPTIEVADASHEVAITGNIAHGLPDSAGHSDWTIENNEKIQDLAPKALNFYDRIFIAARTGDPRNFGSFRYLPDSLVTLKGLGAPMLRPDAPKPAEPVSRLPQSPAIWTKPDDLYPARIEFDAATGSKLEGLDLAKLTFAWDMGDGTTASGPVVTHDFTEPGEYTVTLRTTLPDGTTRESTSLVHPRPAEILHYDPTRSKIFSYAQQTPREMALSDSVGSIRVGGKYPAITIAPDMIAPFFETDQFELSLRVRTERGYRGAGELLRVHPFFFVNVGPRGALEVRFSTPTSSQLQFSTAPTAIFSGEWVDLSFRYSNRDANFQVFANGKLIGSGRTTGALPQLQSWGLSLGNPFNTRKSFEGEIGGLSLRVGEHVPD